MDKRITKQLLDKVMGFQRSILSAYDEFRGIPNNSNNKPPLNLFNLAQRIFDDIFLPLDDEEACKFFIESFGTDNKNDWKDFINFFKAVIINFVNPPIDNNPAVLGEKIFTFDKVVDYLLRFFMMIKNNFIFFIDIFKKAFGKSTQSPVEQIAVFMILHMYNEIAYSRVQNLTNPDIGNIIHSFLKAPNESSVGSFLQEAIFAVALNFSSKSSLSLSLNINLPESGDCLTVFPGNTPSSITELKSSRPSAQEVLGNFLRIGVRCKTSRRQIIGADNPFFTFCSAFNSAKFLLRSPQGNARRTNGSQPFATLKVLGNSGATAEGSTLSALGNVRRTNGSQPFATLKVLDNSEVAIRQPSAKFRADAAAAASQFNRSSDRCKLLFRSLRASTRDGRYSRDDSCFLVGITASDLESLDDYLNACIRFLVLSGQLNGPPVRVSLLTANFPSSEEDVNQDLTRLRSLLSEPLTGEVDLSTRQIKENSSIFARGARGGGGGVCLSSQGRALSLVKSNSEKRDSRNWIMENIIGQSLQSTSGAEATASKTARSQSRKKNNAEHASESNGASGAGDPIQNAGAKKPAKKDSVNKQSKKADAKKLTAKKDAKKTTKSKTAITPTEKKNETN